MNSVSKEKKTGLSLKSDALQANLLETATDEVVIDEALHSLIDIVIKFQGLSAKLEKLLHEISHPFRNWQMIIPELRSFVLKNIEKFHGHQRGPEAFALFTSIFFDALVDSQKNSRLSQIIIEATLAYADKLITALAYEDLKRYGTELNGFFARLTSLGYELDLKVMMYMVQGHHPMKKMAVKLLSLSDDGTPKPRPKTSIHKPDYTAIAVLMRKILTLNYRYWLAEDDPYAWFEKNCGKYCSDWQAGPLFAAVSHASINQHLQVLQSVNIDESPLAALEEILKLPAHMDIVRLYRAIPAKLAAEPVPDDEEQSFAENRKLLFLFRIMDTGGLYLIHEETLREVNRSLIKLIRKQSFDDIERFFVTTFQLLQANVRKYPHTSLQCIQVIGGEVFKRGNALLVEAFLWQVVRFGFQYANVMGVDEDWQPISNPAHLANIRVWLNLIMQEPKWCSTLFSALIINIKLSGTCVKDTDLFQRDITDLLNHPIGPIYNLAKQFTKLMPVFFNEIGAEGELREVSTELDELNKRRDVLIHFLRKQSHVESSNLIVDFIAAIFRFWVTLDKVPLADFLPNEVYSQIETSGLFVDELHTLTLRIRDELHFDDMKDILAWDRESRLAWLERQSDISAVERKRFELLVRMYKLLHQKYNLSLPELRNQLEQAAQTGFPEMGDLLVVLEECDTSDCLEALLDHLEKLKGIILSEEKFEPREEIYYKRHIAIDIPSVYGRYSEKKFDALGLSFRLENLANIYLEQLSLTINLNFITQATFIQIVRCLRLYLRALRIDGIFSRRLDTYASLLASSIDIKRFSYTQHLDIMRGLSEGVKDVIYAYYTNIHENNLSIITPQIGLENLLTPYRPLWDEDDMSSTVLRLSESFLRDLIATTFGLQHLDNFIGKIIRTLEDQKELLDEETLDLLMTYNPRKAISSLFNENLQTHNLIHLGNKGFNLMVLARDGKPVPPAAIITTEIFRCWPAVSSFDRARDELMRRVRGAITEIEELTDKVFGAGENPLLLSVRSGSAMSMPGMMSTIHNVGANVDLTEEFARYNPEQAYFAWDNYRRFIQSWAMGINIHREEFQVLMNNHKEKYNKKLKKEFSADQMRELALNYEKAVRRLGFEVPEDPWLQLIGGVELVLASWNTPKACEYRRLMDVSDDWGTAVIIQTMVYGNLSREAGSGVLFTAHPYRKVRRVALWGDYACGDQGEDIVSGLVTSYPVSVEQAELDGRLAENTLERKFPAIYERLLSISRDLVYTKEWNPQEIEFTFEGPDPEDLYILQTRDMITIKKQEQLSVFVDQNGVQDATLGRGIGVSGSAMSGRAVFTEENISRLREEDPESVLILIRQDTVPEDIREISMADGLLTARGGQTSHASVVATRLEKTCVVGCRDLQVYETMEYAEIHGDKINFGDPIAIDGRNGLFLNGNFSVREEVHILPL